MNNKAQVGDTLQWAVAFVIIFFIMLLFTLGVSFLYKERGYKDLGFEKLNKKDYYNYKAIFAVDFYNQNKEIIFKWADDKPISRVELINGNANPETKKNYDELSKAYTEFAEKYNFDEPYFYIRTSENEMFVTKIPGGKFNDWNFKNPTNNEFSHNFKLNPLVQDDFERAFFVLDSGKLIMIIFYDKTIEKERVYGTKN